MMSAISFPGGFAKPFTMAKSVLEKNMLRFILFLLYLICPEKCLKDSRHSINICGINGVFFFFLPHKECDLDHYEGHNKLSTQPFIKCQGNYCCILFIYHRVDFYFVNIFINDMYFKYIIVQKFLTCTIIQFWYNFRFSVLVYKFKLSYVTKYKI